MKQLSIIIPVLNEQDGVVERLSELQSLRNSGCEIVLVDGGSTDKTLALSAPLVDKSLTSESGRAVQMNTGASVAKFDVFLFLHIDTTLPSEANTLIANCAANHKQAWGWFNLGFDNSALLFRVISSSMNMRASLTKVCTGDQTLFVTRDLFEAIGGFPNIQLMEDVAICKKLRKLRRPAIIKSSVCSSARRWESNGVVKTVLFMWWLRLLYFMGAKPANLAKRYYPNRDATNSEVEPQIESQGSQMENPANQYLFPDARILVFAKAPILGQVKTRLEPHLNQAQCLQLHRAMTTRVVETVAASNLASWRLWVSSDASNEYFLSLCNKKKIYLQSGSDLGEKMAFAIQQTLAEEGVSKVIILGADCPGYSQAYLERALTQLDGSHDVVLGPAEDGGYVLIGAKQANSQMFDEIQWGTSDVLSQTVAQLEAIGLAYSMLETLWDVDRQEDLLRLELLNPPLAWN